MTEANHTHRVVVPRLMPPAQTPRIQRLSGMQHQQDAPRPHERVPGQRVPQSRPGHEQGPVRWGGGGDVRECRAEEAGLPGVGAELEGRYLGVLGLWVRGMSEN